MFFLWSTHLTTLSELLWVIRVLRKQMTFATPPTVSPRSDVWWRVTTQNRVVLLIGWSTFPTRHDQSEALPRSSYWCVISMEFLRSFLRRHFAGKPLVTWRNVVCFLSIYGSHEKKRMSGMRKGLRERLALLTRNGAPALFQAMFWPLAEVVSQQFRIQVLSSASSLVTGCLSPVGVFNGSFTL